MKFLFSRLNHSVSLYRLAALFIATVTVAPSVWAKEAGQTTLNPPIVNIQAEARAEVAQDTVQFVLFVQKEGAEQAALTQEVNHILAQALAQAKQLAADKDIHIATGAFSVSPRYNKEGQISTWQARAELILKSQQIDDTAEIAGKLSDLLSIARIHFSLSDQARTKEEDALTASAIRAFEDRAQLMVSSLGYDYYLLKELTLDSSATVFFPGPQARAEIMMAAASDQQEGLAVAAGQAEVAVTARGSIYLLYKKDTCQ